MKSIEVIENEKHNTIIRIEEIKESIIDKYNKYKAAKEAVEPERRERETREAEETARREKEAREAEESAR